MERVTVTFNYDPETKQASDIQCVVGEAVMKKKTTRKKSEVSVELEKDSLITLETNKLVFNNKAAADLGIEYESRVIIKWEKPTKGDLFPIIGSDLSFGEEGNGNKITKAITMQYKGNANTVLAEKGNQFTLEPYKDGIFKLIPIGGSVQKPSAEIAEVQEVAERIETEVITEDSVEATEITDIDFIL